MKRGAWAAVFGLAPVLVSAALGPRYGGRLRVGALGTAPSLEPRAVAGPTSRLVLGMVHETLLRRAPDGVRSGLAESWTSAADGREWTLTLFPRLTFHDGAPLTAADGARSLRRFLRSESSAASVLADALEGGAAYRAGSPEIAGLEAPDAARIVLRFRVPVSAWSLLPLASPAAAVLSERGTACGPFVPGVTSGDELRFSPFGAHVDGRPFLDRVTVQLLPDPRRLTADLRLGRLHVAVGGGGGVPHAPGVVLLALDPSRPPFDSKELRLAVASAIDRGTLAGRTLPDAQPWHWLLATDPTEKAAASPSAAGGGARAAGHSVVLVVDRSLPPLASQRIVAHLDALGIATSVRAVEPSAVRRTAAEARLLLFEPEIDEPVLAVHELASLFEPADVPLAALEGDPAARHAMALELEQRLRAAGTLIPLARLSRSTEVAASVQGVRADAHTLRLEDAWALP